MFIKCLGFTRTSKTRTVSISSFNICWHDGGKRTDRSMVMVQLWLLRQPLKSFPTQTPTWGNSILNKFPNWKTMKSLSHLQLKSFIKERIPKLTD